MVRWLDGWNDGDIQLRSYVNVDRQVDGWMNGSMDL